MAGREELRWGRRRNMADRSQESTVQTPPLALPVPGENLFPKVTFHLPILSQLAGENLEKKKDQLARNFRTRFPPYSFPDF